MGDHDALFKRVFGVPAYAAAALRSLLPKALLDALDLSRLERVDGSFVDDEMGQRHTDLLFRAPLGGCFCYFYLLFEHQSQPDPLMPFRVNQYVGGIWTRALRDEPGRRTLPLVITVVVHHGAGGWNAPKSLHAMVEGLEGLAELAPYVPNLELLVDDLSRASNQELKRRPLPPVPKLAVWLLRDGRDMERLLAELHAWASEFALATQEAPGEVAVLLRYILKTAGECSLDEVRRIIIEHVPSAEGPLASAADQLIQEGLERGLQQGMQRGLQQGIQRGLQQGREAGQRDTLRLLLVERFGPLDATIEARIAATPSADLERCIRRAVTAASAADVFAVP